MVCVKSSATLRYIMQEKFNNLEFPSSCLFYDLSHFCFLAEYKAFEEMRKEKEANKEKL